MRRVVTLVLLTVLTACNGGDEDRASPSSTTTTTTTTAPPSSTTSTTSAAEAARQQGFFEGDLRFLTPPKEPTFRDDDGSDCNRFADPGWKVLRCGRVTSPLGDAIWVHELNDEPERALLYVREGGRWRLALRASDDTGTEFDALVEPVDVVGDGTQKVFFLFAVPDRDRTDGEATPVVGDVAEPSGVVVVHVVAAYAKGRPAIRAEPRRGVEVWDCAVDCVSTAPHRYRRISYANGRWAVVEQGTGTPP